MAELITSAEVIAIAFTDGQYIEQSVISPCDIEAATERWVTPVVGRALLDAVAGGKYGELKEDYLKPVIALYTRLLVQPRLNVQTSQLGLTVPSDTKHRAADEKARAELRHALRERADSMRRRLWEYLEQHSLTIAEYHREDNILNRCSCDGGFVQIF
mgnify:CR=1 FL=1